jgi:hypothetical protein
MKRRECLGWQRLTDVDSCNLFAAFQVGNGASNLEGPVVGADRQLPGDRDKL